MNNDKNIFKFIIISFITITACFYALKWHAVYKENNLTTPLILEYISEIKNEELFNYTNENLYSVVYFCSPNNIECDLFDKELKKYILKNNLKDTFVYLNVDNISLDSTFNNDELRKENKQLNEVPAIGIYQHTELVDFISGNNIDSKMISNLLENYNIIGD